MMNYDALLSEKARSLKPSAIRRFFDLMENIKDSISLGIGEPDFVTPWHIRDAGIYSLEKGFTKYSPNAGLTELRRQICLYMKRRFGLDYDPGSQTVVTVGGSEAIDLCVRALVNPGDEVIIPQPSFVCYEPIVTMAGGKPVLIKTAAENRFRVTAAQIKRVLTSRTKLLILPYPNNPTGAVLEKEDLEEIAGVIRGTDILVLTDEIYAELTYGAKHVSMASVEGMYERTVVVNGFSKCYAMTGWRLGYACGPREIVSQMIKIHQYAIMCAPTTSQYAAVEAMANGDRDIETMREDYDKRRRLVVDGLNAAGLECFEPQGAFYAFPSIRSTGLSSVEFCENLLMKERVAVIPGNAFGENGEGHVRCCYAASVKELTEALGRIARFVKKR